MAAGEEGYPVGHVDDALVRHKLQHSAVRGAVGGRVGNLEQHGVVDLKQGWDGMGWDGRQPKGWVGIRKLNRGGGERGGVRHLDGRGMTVA